MFIDWVYDFVQVPVMMVTAISTGTWPQEENIKTLGTPSKNKNFIFSDIEPIAFYPYTH